MIAARNNFISVLAFLFGISVCVSAKAQDKVWLEPKPSSGQPSGWYPQTIEILAGDVIEFDASRFTIRTAADQQERSFAANRVLWIEPEKLGEKQTLGTELFEQRKFNESLFALLDALKERPPIWRQQWLSMMAAQAAWRSGRSKIALELVSQLDRRPLPPLSTAWLPIAWQSGRVEREAFDAATERIDDPSSAVRLVASSWLLSSSDRAQATKTLSALRRDAQRPEIAKLAEFVLLRTLSPQVFSMQVERWQERLDSTPMVLQVGPTLTMIERLKGAGSSNVAIAKRLELSLRLTPPHPHPDL
ncbi:hypothetical protein Q31b_05700 [Novipirellula aureliae]|uniref:HEAT repeat protein n=1 Tax=Novipirellula aureliae TaxID=2527966 RepID=A0A5C6E993_9BACT|nr:hypothetical protein [Novipirellula aureliae]TWU45398.1 hypothetical protein Q31b_05700 [Novipirellula aureliae]